jgi:hypothetical protein
VCLNLRKDWWAYRRTYCRSVQDELVCGKLEEKCLDPEVKLMVRNIKAPAEVWNTLEVCSDRPQKGIVEVLDTIVKFQKYKVFEYTTIRELYPLLHSIMMKA